MSTLSINATAIDRPAVSGRQISYWIVAAIVVVPTFMEILDTTIANVALRYIAGGLSAAQTDAEWVITSYLAANAIILPITGWLSSRLGRRNYFLLSIAGFTLASALCGVSTSLGMMIVCRIVQGLCGGGLQPGTQGVLLDAFPEEKQGTAMTLFGVAAIIAPIVGPTLGGWICVDYNWRWIFLINVPLGLVALIGAFAVVVDPDYLKKERAALRREPLNFDYIGLGLLSLVMACWEIALSKGQEWDWLSDPFWRVQTLAILFVLGLTLLIAREMLTSHPIVNFRVLGERNLAVACIVMFLAFAVLYGASIALPSMLQELFGYDALYSGLVMSPSGISSLAAMVLVGVLMTRGLDARWMCGAGLAVMAVACWWMARLNIEISPWQVIWPRMLLTLGLGLLFAPMTVAAFKYTPAHLRAAAVGLLSLLRTEGGSVGTSMAQTIEERREQFHMSRLNEWLGPLNSHVDQYLSSAQRYFFQATGEAVRSMQMGVQTLDMVRQQQSASLAYFDVFWLSAVLSAGLVLLILLMKRSVAEKGERIGGE